MGRVLELYQLNPGLPTKLTLTPRIQSSVEAVSFTNADEITAVPLLIAQGVVLGERPAGVVALKGRHMIAQQHSVGRLSGAVRTARESRPTRVWSENSYLSMCASATQA